MRPGPGGRSGDSRGCIGTPRAWTDEAQCFGGTPGPDVMVPPTCNLPAAVTVLLSSVALADASELEGGPSRATGVCLHQGNGHCRSRGPHLPRPARQSTGSADIPATDEKGWDRRRERTTARQRILIKLQIYFKMEGVI